MTNATKLFSPGQIGSITTRNRVVMPPMGTAMASAAGEITDHHIAYYAARSRGGVGLIVMEGGLVEPVLGKFDSGSPHIDNNRFIPMLHRLVNAVHNDDTRLFVQLNHAGRQSNSVLSGGRQIVAPSPIASPIIGETPRALTLEEIADLEDRFVQGALRCKMAGADGVELHGAHGYLIQQFFSPSANQREDAYGGAFENRMRFATNIIDGIKTVCGADFPILIRLSVDEFVDGGITLDEGVKIAARMAQAGVDGIDVSCGDYASFPKFIEPVSYAQGWRVYLAEAVKKAVDIPVITVGVIREPAVAERILAEGKADFVAIGRGHITDPEWCNKAQKGETQRIRKCISCLYCIDNAMRGAHLECAINARAGREREFGRPLKNGDGRKVVVVGGGPAGMEAARILAARNFKVVLLEKRDRLGGQVVVGSRPRGKEKMIWLIDFLSGELKRLAVEIRFNTEAHPEAILAEKPHAVFVCTGGVPIVPDAITFPEGKVITGETALMQADTFSNETVAIIGAGMTGCEAAELLAAKGNTVYLVDMLAEVAADAGAINRMDILAQLEAQDIHILTRHQFLEMTTDQVALKNLEDGSRVELTIDKVVLCLGVAAKNNLYEPLKERMGTVHLIGDASKPRRIADAIREGFTRAMRLD